MDSDAVPISRAGKELKLRGLSMLWGQRTYVMGIVNVTPDSFSGDGLLAPGVADTSVKAIVSRTSALEAAGADLLDIGGESSRPGSTPVSAVEELSRVIPVIRALRGESDAPISIDTSKARVASAALEAGADMVNDVWGLRMDPDMAHVIAQAGAPVIIMHNRSRPKDARQTKRLGGHYVGVEYSDLMADITSELCVQVRLALEAGIPRQRIIVDPGIGFGKTVAQNLRLIGRLGELRQLGLPILIGPSRKSFIGHTLDATPEERLEGTLAAIGVAAAQQAADIVRVHDVAPTVRFCRMLDAILRA